MRACCAFVAASPDVLHELVEQAIELPEEFAFFSELGDWNLDIRQIEKRVFEKTPVKQCGDEGFVALVSTRTVAT